jgi:hypothetical protein
MSCDKVAPLCVVTVPQKPFLYISWGQDQRAKPCLAAIEELFPYLRENLRDACPWLPSSWRTNIVDIT